jgi:hypothetical protein
VTMPSRRWCRCDPSGPVGCRNSDAIEPFAVAALELATVVDPPQAVRGERSDRPGELVRQPPAWRRDGDHDRRQAVGTISSGRVPAAIAAGTTRQATRRAC